MVVAKTSYQKIGAEMKFELNENNRNITDEILIADLLRVVRENSLETITREQYNQLGKYDAGTLRKRFGGWLKTLEKAGLEKTRNYSISDKELYKNLESVWIRLGRQPKRAEMNDRETTKSEYSSTTYEKRFGSWRLALEAFVEFINDEKEEESKTKKDSAPEIEELENIRHKTKREISERLRFKILLRDGFKCKKCGRSPLNEFNVELHVDHIIPWSKGGETIPENLETKCRECNLGKGNAFSV